MNDYKMTPGERRATWGLGTVFSLRMLGMFMVLPVLTTYGMALQGASEALIGIAIGIYGLTQAVFQIPFGLLSDRIGRKPLIVGGLAVFAAGSVIAALSDSIWGIILGRALQGSGAIAAAVMALLSDLTREQNRTKAMAFIGVSFGITFAIAMVLGPIITHKLGLHALFWMIAILATTGIALTIWVVPNSSTHVLNRESGMVKGSFSKVLAEPRLLKLNFGIMCLHILLMSTFVALPGQMADAGLPAAEHWKVYLATMLIAFGSVVPFIIYAEVKRKMKQVFVFCVGLIVVAEIVLWNAQTQFWQLVVGVQLFFVAFNLMEALLPSLISKESPAGYKGTAMGVYSTSQFLGVAIGGSLGGWIDGMFDGQGVFLAGAMLAAVWLAVANTMKEPPYVSSLRIEIPANIAANEALKVRLLETEGIKEVLIAEEEHSETRKGSSYGDQTGMFLKMDEDGKITYVKANPEGIKEDITLPEETDEEVTFDVEMETKDGASAEVGHYDTIEDAVKTANMLQLTRSMMRSANSDVDVSVYSKNVLRSTTKPSIVKFKVLDGGMTTPYKEVDTNISGYTSAVYAVDAAYLGTVDGKVKFRMAGVTGLVDAKYVTIQEYTAKMNVSYYYVTKNKLYHQIFTPYYSSARWKCASVFEREYKIFQL